MFAIINFFYFFKCETCFHLIDNYEVEIYETIPSKKVLSIGLSYPTLY